MLTDGPLTTLMSWVSVLLVLESLLDVGALLGSIWWWIAAKDTKAWLPLRVAAAATLLHAVRVVIYALDRTGPWFDFDRRPAYRGVTPPEWTWVIFATVLTLLGVVGVVIIWRTRRRCVRG